MLQVTGLFFDYEQQPLLNEIQLTVTPGQLLHLRGNNGAGKTTLIKLLAGLLQPHQGEIYFNQQLIWHDLSSYQKNICYIGHKPGLNGLLTVRENYELGLFLPAQLTGFEQLVQDFSLAEQLDQACAQLSMGQRRRASLLRLSLSGAALWLLDEPFIGLDKPAVASLSQLIAKHLQKGGLVVMTSHQDWPASHIPIQEYCL